MMVVVILFGGSQVHGPLSPLGSAERAAAIAIIIIGRPLAGLIGMIGFRAAPREKLMLTVFPSGVSDRFPMWLRGSTMARLAVDTGCEPLGMVGPLLFCRPNDR